MVLQVFMPMPEARLILIKNSIVQILIICVVSFVVTFAVTAYTVTFVMKIQERFRRKRIGSGDEC